MSDKLNQYLSGFVTKNRWNLIQQKSKERTRYIAVLLEDIYQSHNASAVLRTCDCFGVQDIHIVENQNKYIINPDVTVGASAWVNVNKYRNCQYNTIEAIQDLKKKGYRIVATSPHVNGCSPEQFNLSKGPAVFAFGKELHGLSEDLMEQADEYLCIPTIGFTESLNLSVSAAIVLYSMFLKLRSSDINWQMDEEEKNE
ncbi:MAG: TrmH family RNA methyltransferase, partial [Bacteroidota bacterium]